MSALGPEDVIRSLRAAVQHLLANDGPSRPADRLILAAALTAGAAMLAWPQGRTPPRAVQVAAAVGRELWLRRGWLS